MPVPTELILVGLPTPATSLVADYLRELGRCAFSVEQSCSIETSGHFAEPLLPKHLVYLRLSTTGILRLLSLKTADRRETSNIAAARRYDTIWRSNPSFTIEQAASAAYFIPNFLTTHFGIRIDSQNRMSLQESFAEFRSASLALSDPLLWFARTDLSALSRSSYDLNVDYSLGARGRAAECLVDGWFPQEKWGVWSRGHVSTLRIRADSPISRIILTCARLRSDLEYSIVSDHNKAHVSIKHGPQSDVLNVDFEETYTPEMPKDITLRFVVENPMSPKSLGINGDTRVIGLGLQAMRLEYSGSEDVSRHLPRRQEASLKERLLNGRFRVQSANVEDDGCLAALDYRRFLARLDEADQGSIRRVLVIGPSPEGIQISLAGILSKLMLIVAIRTGPTRPGQSTANGPSIGSKAGQTAENVLIADLSDVMSEPDLSAAFDVVCIVDVEGIDDVKPVLGLACRAFKPEGLIVGIERSETSCRKVVGGLVDQRLDRNLVVLLDKSVWLGRSSAHGLI